MDLVDALMQIQRERGLPNHRMAAALGISRVHWIRVKGRQYQAGDRVQLGALRAFGVSYDEGHLQQRAPTHPVELPE